MSPQPVGDTFPTQWQDLFHRVRRRFPWLDPAWIEDAIGEALLHQLVQESGEMKGTRQGTEKLSVRSLYGEVCRRVGHSIRADKRRHRREHEYARGKKSGNITKNSVIKSSSAGNIDVDAENGSVLRQALEDLLTQLTGRDRDFVKLRRQGMEDFHVYAELLGVTEGSPEKQKRAVDRERHRLQMKLRRMAAELTTYKVPNR